MPEVSMLVMMPPRCRRPQRPCPSTRPDTRRHGLLDGLHLVAVLVLLKQNAGTTDLELKALAAHGLHQDGQVQDAAARDLDAALVLEPSIFTVTLFSASLNRRSLS